MAVSPDRRRARSSAVSSSGVLMSYIEYANQGATRSQPLSSELIEALSFMPELGITARVFSGGQPATGSNRVGSTRHDHGDAADVLFFQGDRQLDWRNSADVPIYQEIVARSRAAGVEGFGAGENYMTPGSMHLGFGTPAVWGEDGRGANAPQWLRDAYEGEPGSFYDAINAPAEGSDEEQASNKSYLDSLSDALAYLDLDALGGGGPKAVDLGARITPGQAGGGARRSFAGYS